MAPFDPTTGDSIPTDPSLEDPSAYDVVTEERPGCLKKVLLTLALGSVVVAAVAVFGGRALLSKLPWPGGFVDNPQKVHAWLDKTEFRDIPMPAGYAYSAVYRFSGNQVFVIRPDNASTPLPHDAKEAMDFRAQERPTYYLISVKKGDDIETRSNALFEQVRTGLNLTPSQDRIWVAEKDMPAVVGQAASGSRLYRVTLLRFPEGMLVAATPIDEVASAPDRDLIGAVLHQKPESISFLPPEPPSIKLARTIIKGDATARKSAVTQIALIEGSHPEAVSFLADGLTTSPPEVKTDIIAALGLLAKQNPDAIAVLTIALGDKSVRLEAMAALGSLGSAAGAAAPKLQAISKDKKEPKGVRKTAQQTLQKIQGYKLIPPPAHKKTTAAPAKKKKH